MCYGVIPFTHSWGSASPRNSPNTPAGGIGLLVSALLVKGCHPDVKPLHLLLGMARSSLPGRAEGRAESALRADTACWADRQKRSIRSEQHATASRQRLPHCPGQRPAGPTSAWTASPPAVGQPASPSQLQASREAWKPRSPRSLSLLTEPRQAVLTRAGGL